MMELKIMQIYELAAIAARDVLGFLEIISPSLWRRSASIAAVCERRFVFRRRPWQFHLPSPVP